MRIYSLTCTLVFASVLAGCGSEPVHPDGPQSIPELPVVSLSASPQKVQLGQSASLSWIVTGATNCVASGAWSGARSPASGTEAVVPVRDSTYALTCTGNGGSAKSSVEITTTSASSQSPSVSIDVSPSSILAGESALLTWSSTNSTACVATTAWAGDIAISGTSEIRPLASGSYGIVCSGPAGSASATTTVLVQSASIPAPTITISSNLSTVNAGQSVVVAWTSSNANS